mmetsp:Transcript_2076/g.3128  ORF Transcript_2076/g.3128 Transcript_2076/m.3128 type:complete len:213 (+) Transcript_2076:908-1546(+)
MEKLIEEISKQFNTEGEKKQKRSSQEMIKQYLNLRNDRALVTVGSSSCSPHKSHEDMQVEGGEAEGLPLEELAKKSERWKEVQPKITKSLDLFKEAQSMIREVTKAKLSVLAKIAGTQQLIAKTAAKVDSQIDTLSKHKARLNQPLKMKLKAGVSLSELRAQLNISSEPQSPADSLEHQIEEVMGTQVNQFEQIIKDFNDLTSDEGEDRLLQ